MNLSTSNVLFHFTGIDHKRGCFKPDDVAFDTLCAILHSGHLLINNCERHWRIPPFGGKGGTSIQFRIPMVCFTETPLPLLKDHMNTFGHFGIGLTLDWGCRNRAQNVIYCDNDNPNALVLRRLRLDSPISVFGAGGQIETCSPPNESVVS